jgi:hypothetical protein
MAGPGKRRSPSVSTPRSATAGPRRRRRAPPSVSVSFAPMAAPADDGRERRKREIELLALVVVSVVVAVVIVAYGGGRGAAAVAIVANPQQPGAAEASGGLKTALLVIVALALVPFLALVGYLAVSDYTNWSSLKRIGPLAGVSAVLAGGSALCYAVSDGGQNLAAAGLSVTLAVCSYLLLVFNLVREFNPFGIFAGDAKLKAAEKAAAEKLAAVATAAAAEQAQAVSELRRFLENQRRGRGAERPDERPPQPENPQVP